MCYGTVTFKEGPEEIKYELGFRQKLVLEKWDLGHWDWESQAEKQ